MKNFGLLGAAGFIAPRHLKAIRETGNQLLMACDPRDAVGILDSYFPDAEFYTSFDLFEANLAARNLLKNNDSSKIDILTVCTPNHFHESHIVAGLRAGCDVICEKPITTTIASYERLIEWQRATGKTVSTVLQLRLHPMIRALSEKVKAYDKRHRVQIAYVTTRGSWYDSSWKSVESRSGGIGANIGVHFFDMLSWVFGQTKELHIGVRTDRMISGELVLENADVSWFLSIDASDLPHQIVQKGQRTYRLIEVDGEPLEFSEGFTDLHTLVYRDIIVGKGVPLSELRSSVEITEKLRVQKAVADHASHPLARKHI